MFLEENTLIDGRYRIIEPLGEGSFGETYKAEDTKKMKEIVVVKRLKVELFSREYLEKTKELFEREAETLKQLGSHPQIPKLEAYFEDNSDFYLVMEYIDDENLSEQELKEGNQLEEEKVIELLNSILKILQVIHSKNLVHRDIKPNNLIRRSIDKQIVLIDFGCVTNDLNLKNKNQTNGRKTTIGSVYASPEQFHGEAYPCSDIYAVGMIGIQALTARTPENLPRDPITGEKIWKHLTSASDDLKQVIQKMVCVNRFQRYQTVDEVLRGLDIIKKSQFATKSVIFTSLTRGSNKLKIVGIIGSIALLGIISTSKDIGTLITSGYQINLFSNTPSLKEIFPLPDDKEIIRGTTITIGGSGAMLSDNNNFKTKFENTFLAKTTINLELYKNVDNIGSNKGIELLCQGKIDIAASSRSLKNGEKCPDGKKIQAVQVGTDSLSVYVHRDNPINNLTKSEIQNIAQCKTTKWSDLSPTWTAAQNLNIEFLNRPPQGGTHDAFQKLFLENKKFCSRDNSNYDRNFKELIDDEYTHTNRNFSVNQISYGSYEHTKFSGIKRLSIDGIKPEGKNYPYKRPLFYVYVVDQEGQPESLPVKQFIGFVLNYGIQ